MLPLPVLQLTINDSNKLFLNNQYSPRLWEDQLLFFTVNSSIRNSCAVVRPITEKDSTHYYKSSIKFQENFVHF